MAKADYHILGVLNEWGGGDVRYQSVVVDNINPFQSVSGPVTTRENNLGYKSGYVVQISVDRDGEIREESFTSSYRKEHFSNQSEQQSQPNDHSSSTANKAQGTKSGGFFSTLFVGIAAAGIASAYNQRNVTKHANITSINSPLATQNVKRPVPTPRRVASQSASSQGAAIIANKGESPAAKRNLLGSAAKSAPNRPVKPAVPTASSSLKNKIAKEKLQTKSNSSRLSVASKSSSGLFGSSKKSTSSSSGLFGSSKSSGGSSSGLFGSSKKSSGSSSGLFGSSKKSTSSSSGLFGSSKSSGGSSSGLFGSSKKSTSSSSGLFGSSKSSGGSSSGLFGSSKKSSGSSGMFKGGFGKKR